MRKREEDIFADELHEEIRRQHKAGVSVRSIAKSLGISRYSVQVAIGATSKPPPAVDKEALLYNLKLRELRKARLRALQKRIDSFDPELLPDLRKLK